MLKGYWQVPLTHRACKISEFVTPSGLNQIMKNAPATFQRMVNKFIRDIDGCEGCIDDVVIYSDNWSDHVRQIKRFFQMKLEVKLAIKLMKIYLQRHCDILSLHCRSGAGKTLRCKIQTC